MQNTLPIHVQLENLIRDKIANGEYAIGSCLPSERRLAETYGINRLTVRAALKNLRQEGLIVAHQGRGNFVNSARNAFKLFQHPRFRHSAEISGCGSHQQGAHCPKGSCQPQAFPLLSAARGNPSVSFDKNPDWKQPRHRY